MLVGYVYSHVKFGIKAVVVVNSKSMIALRNEIS